MTSALLAQIDSPEATVREGALTRCQTESELAPEMLLAAIRHTNDPVPMVREAAVGVCEREQELDTYLISPLAELLGRVDGDAAYWCATLLGRFGEDAAPVVPQLGTALARLTSVPALQRVVLALGKIGPTASNARPLIQPFTNHPDPHLARTARDVLSQW